MGDSLKWAAEKQQEEYDESAAGKAHKTRVDEWNKLAGRVSTVTVGSLTVPDLAFLLAVKSRYYPHDRVEPSELEQLQKLVGDVVDRLAGLDSKKKKKKP